MTAEKKTAPPLNARQRVQETVSSLLPLYTDDEHDRPDSVLDSYPNPTHIIEGLQVLVDVMFPGKMTPGHIEPDELGLFMTRRLSHAWRILRPEVELALPFRWYGEAARTEGPPSQVDCQQESARIADELFARLPSIRKMLIEDVVAGYEGDPAALTYAEVQLAYPGLLAITSHRIAHELYRLEVPIVPRIMSEWTHAETGVDIHPGAEIGHAFFIDHATGVVIGETSHIGNHVKIYQGVTLGAKSFPLDEHGLPIKHIRRHPTVEDGVIIYANSTILGNITLGANSIVGGNVFLMEDVPPNSFVAFKHPELRIKRGQDKS